jgi:hypothetical protein
LSVKVNFNVNWLIALVFIASLTFSLFYFFDPNDHHPDGITLSGWACLQTESLIGNGALLSFYYPFIDCGKSDSPSVYVALVNIFILAIGLRIYKKVRPSVGEFFFVLISLSFLLYSVFFPSKEIILSTLLLCAIASKSFIARNIFFALIVLVRPVYFPIFFANVFASSRYARWSIIICLAIVSASINSGVFGDAAMLFYEAKSSEYDGTAKILFDSVGLFAPVLRVFWNFLGFPSSLINLNQEFSWHMLFHLGTQVVLLTCLPQFLKGLFSDKTSVNETVLIIFVILTAAFPLPHTRYLYPIIMSYLFIKIASKKM